MASSAGEATSTSRSKTSLRVILSYISDWLILIIVGAVSAILGNIEPRKRPFSLSDPNISLPFSDSETVPLWLLGVFVGAIPILTILVVTFVCVPGATVPRRTPASLIWRRRLWELHASCLGFFTAHVIAFFFTQGMKCLFGKPRPDLLDRCQPSMSSRDEHAIGGFASQLLEYQLYSAAICQQKDTEILDDGFRSFPSGHSSASAAGSVYLSLFLASKLSVAIPLVLQSAPSTELSYAAFPSRMSMTDSLRGQAPRAAEPVSERWRQDSARSQSLRRQAAAPPLYLLVFVLAPFALSIYVSASRWFDYRHHGFDILFGYLIGLIPAVFCFRYYHLPISSGAGWAWAPRTGDRAFWVGVGKLGYRSTAANAGASEASDQDQRKHSNDVECAHDEPLNQSGLESNPANNTNGLASRAPAQNSQSYGSATVSSSAYGATQDLKPQDGGNLTDYYDVEMQKLDRGRSNMLR